MTTIELLRLDGLPVYQNKVFATAQQARDCPRGTLRLAQDAASGLVANAAFDPSLLRYDGTYQNEQAHSPAFRQHMQQVLDIVGRHFRGLELLEIGCGKGRFVEMLRDEGFAARGVDAAYEGDSPHIIPRMFEPSLGIRGDAIVLRHVLEHIPDPAGFLAQVRAANGGDGLVYVEVPCLDWILAHRAWFDLFYEHVNYFRIADFERLFAAPIESGHVFGGQYIYVVARLQDLRDPADPALPPPAPVRLPADFFDAVERCAHVARSARRCLVWGAAAKGVMFTHHLVQRGVVPAAAIDINPAKQGHFLPGTGVPVLAPAQAVPQLDRGDVVFVMNSNYLAEIAALGGPLPTYFPVDQP